MIFLTVGTLFPFDRLVITIDNAILEGFITQEVFAQIGKTRLKPKNMQYVDVLDKGRFDQKAADADYLISHAGIGSITMALECNKPLLVMPRMKRFKEHINDHQVATARKFEQLGHLLAVYCEKELPDKLQQLWSFIPKPRENQADAVTDIIAKFLKLLSEKQISN